MPREPWKISREMFLSEAEVARLRKFLAQREQDAAAATDRLIIEMLLFSGLRNSEFCQLRVADTVVGQKQSILVVRETPRQNRVVYVPKTVSRLIQTYCRDFRPELLPAGVSAADKNRPLVFNDRGKPYERTALYRRVVRILADAGLEERASVQLLRHTYGYLAYKRTGGNLLFVQQQLGHAHPMVTAVYAEFVKFPSDQLADRIVESKPSAVKLARKRVSR
jgi:integrase/recombinase XerD